jgi:hypothetical protein
MSAVFVEMRAFRFASLGEAHRLIEDQQHDERDNTGKGGYRDDLVPYRDQDQHDH